MMGSSGGEAVGSRESALRALPVVGKRGEKFDHPDVNVPSVEVELWCGSARVKNREAGWRVHPRRKRPKLQRYSIH